MSSACWTPPGDGRAEVTTPAALASAPLVALLSELVDDAGLFPPAQLDMADALDAHLRARAGDFRWMLGRFVCPADRIDELGRMLPAASSLDRPVRLSVIGTPSQLDETSTSALLRGDERWRVEAIESRLADDDVAAGADAMAAAARSLGADRAWLEIPWSEFPSDRWATATKAVAAAGPEVGVKIRCGGATADAVPPPSILASVLVCCRDAGVPLKATAGLHHPFRHPDPSTGGMQHGFVNLALGAALAVRHGLDAQDVAEILSDESESSFTLGGDRGDGGERDIGWRGSTVGADDIAESRRQLFAGFGSCSFREPVDDLVALGLLRQTS